MLITNRQFSGQRPKKSQRNLGSNEAKVALDCAIVSDELRPLATNRVVDTVSIADPKTIFLVRDRWVAFPGIVNAITSNIESDEQRVFWTESGAFPQQATLEQLEFGVSFRMGVPKPAAPTIDSLTGTGTGTVTTTFYVATFVNAWGEEGDKSDPSDLVDFQLGQTMVVGTLGNVPANSGSIDEYNVVAVRLYRQDEGAPKFVAEFPVSQNTFTEDTGNTTLGESFSREDYFPPPVDMQGLHLMANGVATGFSGRTVYISEAFLPNAWPYSFEVSSDIVALSSFDNNLVVLTKGYPEIATILDPINVSSSQLSDREPCVSARSVVQGAGGVIYAAPSGLYLIAARGGQMITEQYFDDADWSKLKPETFNSVFRDGEYIAFHEGVAEGRALVFDTREPNAVVTQLSDWTCAAHVREGTDELYLVDGVDISLYQGGERLRTYFWASKQHGGGSPFAIDCRRLLSCDFALNPTDEDLVTFQQVVADAITENGELFAIWNALPPIYGMGGGLNTHVFGGCGVQILPVSGGIPDQEVGTVFGGGQSGGAARIPLDLQLYTVELTVIKDKVVIDTQVVTDDEPERIEYSDRGRLWEYELRGTVAITQADLASSMSELHNGS